MSVTFRLRRGVGAAIVAAVGCSLVACADIAGLDGLMKDGCADGCPDVAVAAADASEATDASEDRPSVPDASVESAEDAGVRDASPPDVSTTADASALDAADVDADAAHDAPDDSTVDTSSPDATVDSGGPCSTVYLSEPFSNDSHGWTFDTSWSIAPTCASPPAPQKGFPDPTSDHTATSTDNGVAGAYVCGNSPASTTSAARYLTSPIVDTAGASSLALTFYRWLNSDSATYMASTVDVYDGTAWVNVYTNPTGSGAYVTDSAWGAVSYDLSPYANATLRVRFGYSLLSTSVYAMSSWNIDDVTISTVACP